MNQKPPSLLQSASRLTKKTTSIPRVTSTVPRLISSTHRTNIKHNSSMSSNRAAWLTSAKAHPFEVKPAPMWTPADNEILVKNHAVAINPVDPSLQSTAWWPMNYPTILGQDVAGEVVSVGPNVTRFKKGDRVVGHAVGMATKRNQDDAFQAYTILLTNMASHIPDTISFERAAVIPLALSTAACALFQEEFLNLQFPTEPAQKPTGKTLLIWGGASSVGSNAIQLTVAAGYEVISTASAKNFDYVRKLGASDVFDYNSPSVIEDLVTALKGKTIVGAFDCIGGPGWKMTTDVVSQSNGGKFIATTKRGFPDPPEGISMKQVFGTSIKDNEVGKAVYEDFLPKALQTGSFVPAPEPLIVGHGLESVQVAVDRYGKGVSAQKLVVTL